jgi:hypothetical protein
VGVGQRHRRIPGCTCERQSVGRELDEHVRWEWERVVEVRGQLLEHVIEWFGSSDPGQHDSCRVKAFSVGRHRWLDHAITLRPEKAHRNPWSPERLA